jgi:hypothetical protein
MANGYIAYEGASAINGKPIKAIVTGTKTASDNRKTGDMLQLWIMPVNSKPSDSVKNGDDASVCGECPHRPLLAKATGNAPCYVNVGQAPNGIFKADYPTEAPKWKKTRPWAKVRNAPMRLGAWGDPAALPFDVAQGLITRKHTGYTHQWRNTDQRFKEILMASADSEAEALEAQAMGWRTFRVRKAHEPLLENEIACPASKEAGYKTQCAQCGLCAGAGRKAKNIAIIEH